SHMSSDTALSLVGLLKTTCPTGPSLRPMIFSSCMRLVLSSIAAPHALRYGFAGLPWCGKLDPEPTITDTSGRRRYAIAVAKRRPARGRSRSCQRPGVAACAPNHGGHAGAAEGHARADRRRPEGRQGQL